MLDKKALEKVTKASWMKVAYNYLRKIAALESQSKSRKEVEKITPGKRETSLETTKYSSKNKKGKATPSSTASCSYTKSVEDELENEEQIWV